MNLLSDLGSEIKVSRTSVKTNPDIRQFYSLTVWIVYVIQPPTRYIMISKWENPDCLYRYSDLDHSELMGSS